MIHKIRFAHNEHVHPSMHVTGKDGFTRVGHLVRVEKLKTCTHAFYAECHRLTALNMGAPRMKV